jgi:hypothetical protein
MTHPIVDDIDDIENDASRGNSGRSTPTTRERKLGHPGDAARRAQDQRRGRIGTNDGHAAAPVPAPPVTTTTTTNEVRLDVRRLFFLHCRLSRNHAPGRVRGMRAKGKHVRGNNDARGRGCNRLGRLTDASTPRKRRMIPYRWRECFKTKSALTL